MTQFGVTEDVKSSNNVNYEKGGFKKAFLTNIKFEEVGKDEKKYLTLAFYFVDIEGIKSFKHSEFAIAEDDTDFQKKLNGMNSRIKHIWEQFATFTPIGVGATSFQDFFEKVALAFSTNGANNTPIFKDEKGKSILVWIKLGYYGKKGDIRFPLSPNFIERVKENNQTEPKSLTIDNRYDTIEQPQIKKEGTVMGTSGINTGTANSGDEF